MCLQFRQFRLVISTRTFIIFSVHSVEFEIVAARILRIRQGSVYLFIQPKLRSMNFLNALLIEAGSFIEVSAYMMCSFNANCSPSSAEIYLRVWSVLWPIKQICTFTSPFYLMFCSQQRTCQKEERLATSNTMIAPFILRQQLDLEDMYLIVSDRQDSWPAVSQICVLTTCPLLRVTSLELNSTAMVGMILLGIFYLVKLQMMLVLPVPASPTRMTDCCYRYF